MGGELVASRAGGTFSTGGRAIRVGWTLILVHFLRYQMVLGGAIGGEEDTLTIKHALEIVLRMVGSEMERQLQPPKAGESGPGNMFGGNAAARNRSKGDGSLVRLAASRVLRQGLSEVATEPKNLCSSPFYMI